MIKYISDEEVLTIIQIMSNGGYKTEAQDEKYFHLASLKYPDLCRFLDGVRSPQQVLDLAKKAKETQKIILG